MSISAILLFVILIAFVFTAFMVSKEMTKNQRDDEDENLTIDFRPITNDIPFGNTDSIFEIRPVENKQKEDFYKDADFVNKECKNLDDFIINDNINAFDLRKLADLNGIDLQISEAWYPLVIELINKLYDNGWDKRVDCIKSKYASLEFYSPCKSQSHLYEIIRDYGFISQTVCETCGENGEIRNYSGWDYVDCRKHYLENRGKITTQSEGFYYRDFFYPWAAIRDRSFIDLDFNNRYRILVMEFDKKMVQNEDAMYGKLYIQKRAIGFGNLLNYLSKNFYRSKNSYVTKFENVEFCEICGYKAVYFGECECCEYDTRENYLKRWKDEENNEEENREYIKSRQMSWIKDEGEIYESKQKNYIKNPNYKLLFDDDELKRWYSDQ